MTEVGPLIMQLYDKTEYVYPDSAKAVGWCLALSSVLMVPIIAIKTIFQLPGGITQVRIPSKYFNNIISLLKSILIFIQRLLASITPENEQKEILDGKRGPR